MIFSPDFLDIMSEGKPNKYSLLKTSTSLYAENCTFSSVLI